MSALLIICCNYLFKNWLQFECAENSNLHFWRGQITIVLNVIDIKLDWYFHYKSFSLYKIIIVINLISSSYTLWILLKSITICGKLWIELPQVIHYNTVYWSRFALNYINTFIIRAVVSFSFMYCNKCLVSSQLRFCRRRTMMISI